jgi:hypothetical protein
MLAALGASGRPATAFARSAGIGLHRVNYWRRKLEGTEPTSAPAGRREAGAGFVAVEVRGDEADGAGTAGDRRVEVTLVNGRRVAFAGGWDAAAIAPWLRALEGDRCSG